MAFDLGVTAMVGLELEQLARAVGDEGMEVVQGQQGELGTRRRADAADDEPDRDRVALVGERGVRVSATSAPPASQYGIGVQASSGIASMRRRVAGLWRMVMEKRTPIAGRPRRRRGHRSPSRPGP